jgi:hypothetical protein
MHLFVVVVILAIAVIAVICVIIKESCGRIIGLWQLIPSKAH